MADDDRGLDLVLVATIFTAISLISLGLRCYTMIFILKRFFPADWTALLTGINQIALCAFTILGVHYGLGKHVPEVSEENRIEALKWKWAGQVSYVIGSTLIKFVAALLLLRLFAGQKWQRITLIVLMVVVGVVQAFYLFVAIFQCTPVPFYWYRYTPAHDRPINGECLNPTMAIVPTYVSIMLGVVSDWFLALLPITLVWNIKMEKKAKVSIVGILAIGSMASIANGIRIPYAKQLLSNPDYLYNFTDLAIWSIIECALGLTATSLAMLRPLFVRMKVFTSTHVLSTFHSKSRSRRNTAAGYASNRAQSYHPHTRGEESDSKRRTLHSLHTDPEVSEHDLLDSTGLPPSERGIIGHQSISEVPRGSWRTRTRSSTEPPLNDAQVHWQPRTPSVGTLEGQIREGKEEAWYSPLQPPPIPKSPSPYSNRSSRVKSSHSRPESSQSRARGLSMV